MKHPHAFLPAHAGVRQYGASETQRRQAMLSLNHCVRMAQTGEDA